MQSIKESDWKLFRQLHPIALERFCQSVLARSHQIIMSRENSAHQRYQELFQLLHQQDQKCGLLFDDLRRSSALIQIAALTKRGWLSDEEVAQFSEETQVQIRMLLG